MERRRDPFTVSCVHGRRRVSNGFRRTTFSTLVDLQMAANNRGAAQSGTCPHIDAGLAALTRRNRHLHNRVDRLIER